MSPAFEKPLRSAPDCPPRTSPDSELNITVVFTSVDLTLSALKEAGALASRLNGRITLIVPQVVPFPLPLTSPPVLLDFNERRFRVIAGQCPVETTVRIYLCRDPEIMLKDALPPRSVVVMGVRRRRWLNAERRTARTLRRQRHEVIFAEGTV